MFPASGGKCVPGRGPASHQGCWFVERVALLNAGMMDIGAVIVMNHGHENDVTELIEDGGKSTP